MSGTLPNAAAIDINVKMPAKHEKLYQYAQQYGGACTKRFSQGSDDQGKGLGYWYHQRSGWHGVCKAMSAYWIFFHALDQDFWGWLYAPNGASIVAQNAARIIDLHGGYKSTTKTRDAWLDDVLAGAKLRPRGEIVSAARLKTAGNSAGFGTRGAAARAIANAVAGPGYEGGSYKQLSFWRPDGSGGHAVALWVERDVAFFDPNYGEYWFETRAAFRQWFESFWRSTGYGDKYTGDYEFTAYARRVN